MNSMTRAFKAEEAVVMHTLATLDIPSTLKQIERATGDKGQRIAIAEHHAFLVEHGLIVEGQDDTGAELVGRWVLSETGLKRVSIAIRDGRANAQERIEKGKRDGVAREEIARLERIKASLPEKLAAGASKTHGDEDDEEDEDEPVARREKKITVSPQGDSGRKGPAKAPKKFVSDGITGKPSAPAAPVTGQRRGPAAPPTRNNENE